MKKIDLIGRVFYRLTVIDFAGVNARRQSLWTCQCLCSKEVVVLSYSLRGGMTKSCGCLNKEKVLTNSLMHGHAKQTKNTLSIEHGSTLNLGALIPTLIIFRTTEDEEYQCVSGG